jgi:hypothetical protein
MNSNGAISAVSNIPPNQAQSSTQASEATGATTGEATSVNMNSHGAIGAVSNIPPNQAQSSNQGSATGATTGEATDADKSSVTPNKQLESSSHALVLAFLKTAGEVRVIERQNDLYIIEARALSPTAPQVHIETDTVAVSDVHVHLIGLADTFSHLTVGLA